jgi:hypothetical protein
LNILILSNSAPGYHRFFNGLAKRLIGERHVVEFAVDSPYCRELNELDKTGCQIHDFGAFFSRARINHRLLDEYRHFPLNAAILSDFERSSVYSIGAERTDDYYLRLQSALLEYFEGIFASSGIDVVLYETVSNAFAHFAWFVCQRRKCLYLGFAASRLPGRYVIIRDFLHEHLPYQSTLKQIRDGEILVPMETREWVADYLKNISKIVPDYMAYSRLDRLSLTEHYVKKGKLRQLRIILRHLGDDHIHAFQTGNPLELAYQMVRRKVLRKLKLKFFDQRYSKPEPDEQYLLYPLHYHPESSTSIHAGSYLDELEVVRNIAFSLPAGIRLYVKDHPSAYGNPPVSFYKKIAALPNVRVISPFEDTKRLIVNSLAVITLTSTAGYEALLLGKRVFLFGRVFYEFHPNVVRIENPAQLFELFTNLLYTPLVADQAYNLDFVTAYYMNTHLGVLNFFLNAEETEKLVNSVAPVVFREIASLSRSEAPAVALA